MGLLNLDMMKFRVRLTGFHYFWLSSIVISFIFGYLDRQCSITFHKFSQLENDSQPISLYQRRLTSPLTMVAPMQATVNSYPLS